MKRSICRLVLGLTLAAAAGAVGAAPAWAQPPNPCNGGGCSGTPEGVGAEVDHCQDYTGNPGTLIATPSPTQPVIGAHCFS
jgi:hypothetical protein